MDIKELSADLILVKPVKNEGKSTAGVLIADAKKTLNMGEVVMVGPGTLDKPMVLKVGDNIKFQMNAGIQEIYNNENVLLMRQSDYIAKY